MHYKRYVLIQYGSAKQLQITAKINHNNVIVMEIMMSCETVLWLRSG